MEKWLNRVLVPSKSRKVSYRTYGIYVVCRHVEAGSFHTWYFLNFIEDVKDSYIHPDEYFTILYYFVFHWQPFHTKFGFLLLTIKFVVHCTQHYVGFLEFLGKNQFLSCFNLSSLSHQQSSIKSTKSLFSLLNSFKTRSFKETKSLGRLCQNIMSSGLRETICTFPLLVIAIVYFSRYSRNHFHFSL